MAQIYTVQQGDFLAKIADQFQINDYHLIWDDPHNAALKQARVSPNVLYPGDSLYIPDKRQKQDSRVTDQKHVHQVSRLGAKLIIVLRDAGYDPIKNTPYKLQIEGTTQPDTPPTQTDGGGKFIKSPLGLDAHVGQLRIARKGSLLEAGIGIKIGDLNPVTTPSGQMARLNNLGYFAGKLETGDQMDRKETVSDDEMAQFESAVEEFQCDHMGQPAVDGKCGKNTQASLLKVYGC